MITPFTRGVFFEYLSLDGGLLHSVLDLTLTFRQNISLCGGIFVDHATANSLRSLLVKCYLFRHTAKLGKEYVVFILGVVDCLLIVGLK